VTRRSIVGVTVLAAVCVWGADLITLVLKSVIDRPRPFEVIPEADPLLTGTLGASLPSGHAATSAAGAVLIAAFVPRAAPALLALALGIAFSRIYVGVHYPADVILGAAIGVAASLLGLRLRGPLRLEESPPPQPRSPRSG
jgi:undecaprenyl-diphosphatase